MYAMQLIKKNPVNKTYFNLKKRDSISLATGLNC